MQYIVVNKSINHLSPFNRTSILNFVFTIASLQCVLLYHILSNIKCLCYVQPNKLYYIMKTVTLKKKYIYILIINKLK